MSWHRGNMDRAAVYSKIDKLAYLPKSAGVVGAGLHIRTRALADLFSSCVDFLERVNWNRNPSHSSEVSLAKLILLEARLRFSGESLGLQAAGQEKCYPRHWWAQEEKEIAESLIEIKGALHEFCLSGHTSLPADGRYELWPNRIDASEGIYSSLQDIKRTFQPATQDRPQEPLLKPWDDVCWVPGDHIGLDTLIDNLATYVDRLERVSGRLHVLGLQRDLLQAKLAKINSRPAIFLLVMAAIESDLLSSSSRVQNLQNGTRLDCTDGHFYLGQIILARARVLNKDMIDTGDGQEPVGIWEFPPLG